MRRIRQPILLIALALALLPLFADKAQGQGGDRSYEEQPPLPSHLNAPPSPALSPADALASFELVDGFRIELVAHEPMIQDPVAMTFDEDGRIWVVEMRGFMTNLDAENEMAPVGRVSILEDTDGDGKADQSVVFADGLVLPRAIAVFGNGALIADHSRLWRFEDEDGDGKSDRKTLVDADYAEHGNVEHRPNGIMRAIDNWYYSGASGKRYRFQNGEWMIDAIQQRGQWGMTQDPFGRLYYNYNWSQLHADLVPPGSLIRNPHHKPNSGVNIALTQDQSVFPIRMNTGVNRGYRPGLLDKKGRLREFASACAPLIYRGNQFPKEFVGDAFVCGPGANIVKRNRILEDGLTLTATNAYPEREFLASTDERFRPVWMSNGPDGCLYIVDMYRGIIQHRAFMTTFLRDEILARDLEKPVHWGRIYRVVHEGNPRPEPPKLGGEKPKTLVSYLAHPNGWIRGTAQRLLVEQHFQSQSAVPAIEKLALDAEDPLTRIQALWTLEGLQSGSLEKLFGVMDDPHPMVQAAGLRVLDSLSAGKSDFRRKWQKALESQAGDSPIQVQLQTLLTLGNLNATQAIPTMAKLARQHADLPVIRDALLSSLKNLEWSFLRHVWTEPDWQQESVGAVLILDSLAAAVVRKGDAEQIEGLFQYLATKDQTLGWRSQALLSGITVALLERRQPLELDQSPRILADPIKNPNPSIQQHLETLNRRMQWPGHQATAYSKDRKARPLTPQETQRFAEGRRIFANLCASCHSPNGRGIKPLGPPLVDSQWVTGSPERLIRIILQGLEGPVHVNGTEYAPPDILPSMPALGTLHGSEIASVLTYIRRAWGHQADPITPQTVRQVRDLTAGRIIPWTEQELAEQDGADD